MTLTWNLDHYLNLTKRKTDLKNSEYRTHSIALKAGRYADVIVNFHIFYPKILNSFWIEQFRSRINQENNFNNWPSIPFPQVSTFLIRERVLGNMSFLWSSSCTNFLMLLLKSKRKAKDLWEQDWETLIKSNPKNKANKGRGKKGQ